MHLSTEYSINTSRCRVPEYYTRINDWQIDIKMVMADILFKSFDKGLYWYKYHIRHANNGFNVSTCICNCIEGCLNLSGALPLVVQWLDGCGRAKGSGRAAALARQSFGFDGSIPGPPLVKFWRGPVGRWVGATLQKVSKHLWFFLKFYYFSNWLGPGPLCSLASPDGPLMLPSPNPNFAHHIF